jgi:ferredoxin--NADP+ reductase
MNKNPLFPSTITQKIQLIEKHYLYTFDRVTQFIPGQALSLALSDDGEERYYSIASPPGTALSILFNLVEEGSLTPELARKGVGDTLWLSPPFGTFYTHQRPITMVATGTGIAPFLCMVKSHKDTQGIQLIHGARKKTDFLFSEIFMSKLADQYIRCASMDDSPGLYPGRLTNYLQETPLDPTRHFLICGSPEMVVNVRELLIGKGVKHEHILSEIYF